MIEVLLTITMLSVLLMIGIPQFTDLSTDAKKAVTRDRMSAIREALVGDPRLVSGGVYTKPGYYGNCLRLPADIQYLVTQPAVASESPCDSTYNPLTRLGWNGAYLDTLGGDWIKDGWSTTIVYDSSARSLNSCGPNTSCGDSDDITLSF